MANPTSACQDPWELAKSRFSQDLEPHEIDLFNNATLENIYYSASNANRADAETSKTRGVVRRLGPLVSAIESYGEAFDTFAQISPLYLSPIWGSIRVVLVVASSYSKFYDKIVDTLGRIGDILPRFRDYERIYNGQKHQRLTQALSNTYLEIITLCSEFRKTIRGQKNSKVRRLLKPLAFDKQFDEAIDRFRQHKQNVEDEARTCHMIEAAEKRDAQLVVFAEERRRKLLAKLSNVDSKLRHRKLKDSRHEGTGLWFLFCPEYENWQAASESSILCCHGIPGCGKSVLASSIIDSWNAGGTLIFYYCDYADKRTLEPSNVFGAMARQALEKLEVLPETLASEIEQAEHDGEKLADPSQALIILQKSFHLVPDPIYLILDGLDEATESAQNLICNNLKQLFGRTGLPIKLLITGREDLSSSLMLEPAITFFRVSMASNAIALDIEKYVRGSTRRLILDGSLVIRDPDLEKLIVSELVDGAKGM
ncbi:hypothetical protein NA56DRAFT_572794 [Hyaloscypha hepaticicola]|uniref:Uncharacterized protein n=1 Tax=Hyaloscypha hepaticicola TaxID=2082293 RepID=A0A2J6Q4N3_9HELO|nr:hypothetical protein NA56DRAFT_572794 [Hyaloscypha hepaticicola]